MLAFRLLRLMRNFPIRANFRSNTIKRYLPSRITAPRLCSKTPRVRIKLLLLLLAVPSPLGCASNSPNPEGKGTRSGMPEITINAPEKKVQATVHF
jgi:hypothetical protein